MTVSQLRLGLRALITLVLAVVLVLGFAGPTAWASLEDDRFDGNIFALYAGNGSLVPPRVSLAEALKRDRPTLLVIYLDDSRDCKQYSSVVSQFQAFYGKAVDIIPISLDAIPPKETYTPTEAGYYFKGFVPQTVAFDAQGKVLLSEAGQVSFTKLDDLFREVFDLLPRSESEELKRRPVNEVNTELVSQHS